MSIQDTLRNFARDNRLLGEYRHIASQLDPSDPEWDSKWETLHSLEQDVGRLESKLVDAGLMAYGDCMYIKAWEDSQ